MTDPEGLIRKIADTQRQLRHWFAEDRDHPLLDVNLTMSQLKIMMVLYRRGRASGQELARRFGVGLATLTGIMDRLVAQGMVIRRQDTRDRRVRRLELTPEGHAVVDRVFAAGEDNLVRVLRRLDPADLSVVAEAFELLVDAARQEEPDGKLSAPLPGRRE
ncbi:MAG TPA: MarR family transcriptional regulator [Actinophytocola sp.]|uniref:MarR family winged helix-turn-helix transcriptional regulator n=1 Tax=Actinophytocola sp. TaxID=1872138 RepID=UPI002DB9D474|nr:MarR family transcriptional regulator [Actinophytocola sp.]HEU5473377.1 MarR family transcriptional regulator [Actinophytocola sp.]